MPEFNKPMPTITDPYRTFLDGERPSSQLTNPNIVPDKTGLTLVTNNANAPVGAWYLNPLGQATYKFPDGKMSFDGELYEPLGQGYIKITSSQPSGKDLMILLVGAAVIFWLATRTSRRYR